MLLSYVVQKPEHFPWSICPFPELFIFPFRFFLIPSFVSSIEISTNHSGLDIPILNTVYERWREVAEWCPWMFPWQSKEGCAEDRTWSLEEGSIYFYSVSEETKSYSAAITITTITITVSQGPRHHQGEQCSVKMEKKVSGKDIKPRYLLLYITQTKLCPCPISCNPKCLLLCDQQLAWCLHCKTNKQMNKKMPLPPMCRLAVLHSQESQIQSRRETEPRIRCSWGYDNSNAVIPNDYSSFHTITSLGLSIVFFFLKVMIATLKLTLPLVAPGALSSGANYAFAGGETQTSWEVTGLWKVTKASAPLGHGWSWDFWISSWKHVQRQNFQIRIAHLSTNRHKSRSLKWKKNWKVNS